MNNLLISLIAQKEFNSQEQLTSEIEQLSRFPKTIQNTHMQCFLRLLQHKDFHKYSDKETESTILQLLIKGVVLKKWEYLSDLILLIEQKICNDKYHLNLLYYLLLVVLQKLKRKSPSQDVNRWLNILEDESKNYIPQLLNLNINQNFILILIKSIQSNPSLFRNQQRQLQEMCITKKLPELFAVLQWAFLEAKTHSYQLQIQYCITSLIDAFQVCSQLLDFDNEIIQLYTHWQNTLLNEEFKLNLQALFHQHKLVDTMPSKCKYSLYFQIIKDSLNSCLESSDQLLNVEEFKLKIIFISQLLKANLNQIKEEIILELPLKDIIQRIGEVLNLNTPYAEYLSEMQSTQHTAIVMQQLSNKLNKLQIDRKIQLNQDQYKTLHGFIKSNALNLFSTLIDSPFSQYFKIHNALIIQVISQFLKQQFVRNGPLLLQISTLITQMNNQQFMCVRLQEQIQKITIELLEQQFPKFMREIYQFKKQVKLHVYKTVQDNKNKRVPQKQQKEYNLGISTAQKLTTQDIKIWRQQLSNWLIVLSEQCEFNLRYQMDQPTIQSINQLIYMILAFPFEQLINNAGCQIIIAFQQMCITILDNYSQSEQIVIQPIQYFLNYLNETEEYEQDFQLQIITQKLLSQINLVRLSKQNTVVDNHFSTIKQLNDQYQKTQLILSEDIFLSFKDNEIESSDRINQIKKVNSLLVEDDSSQKLMKETLQSEDMFYSIQNNAPTEQQTNQQQQYQQQQQQQQQQQEQQQQQQQLNQSIQIPIDEEDDNDFEMPKAIID